jgi:hypothetical protein
VIRDLRALGSPGNEESWLVTSADSLKVGDEACRDGDLDLVQRVPIVSDAESWWLTAPCLVCEYGPAGRQWGGLRANAIKVERRRRSKPWLDPHPQHRRAGS